MHRRARIGIFGYALLFFISFVAYAHASETLGSASGYAWGNELGWINFGCAQCTVQISDAAVTGYAWSSVAGWINFSPPTAGVINDGNGTLSGYAWSSGLGWINFNGVSITNTGVFSGIGGNASSSAGMITFNCSYCGVTTDWRPAGTRSPTPPNPGGGGEGGAAGSISAPIQDNSTTPTSATQPTSSPPPSNSITSLEPVTIASSQGQSISTSDGSKTVPVAAALSSSSVLSLSPSYSLLAKLLFYLFILAGILFFIVFARRERKK